MRVVDVIKWEGKCFSREGSLQQNVYLKITLVLLCMREFLFGREYVLEDTGKGFELTLDIRNSSSSISSLPL